MILETQRLYVRDLLLSDAFRMSEYRNKKEVAKYQSWNHYSQKDAFRRIQQCMLVKSHHRVKTDYQVAIILKENDLQIGDLFVEIINEKTFTLGYTLDSEYWSCGYATEVIEAFLTYMKEKYGFQKVICYVYNNNQRSIRLLERLGFTQFDKSYFYGDIGFLKKL
ncbi:MAG: GNAT family N-acetyltransferase [Erysipelotrichales bacterium]|nr:GNAT family N-acetyltransferase [Erysipelotrichales bacterium]